MKSNHEIQAIEFEPAITEAEREDANKAIAAQIHERNERDDFRRKAALENLHFRKGWKK